MMSSLVWGYVCDIVIFYVFYRARLYWTSDGKFGSQQMRARRGGCYSTQWVSTYFWSQPAWARWSWSAISSANVLVTIEYDILLTQLVVLKDTRVWEYTSSHSLARNRRKAGRTNVAPNYTVCEVRKTESFWYT